MDINLGNVGITANQRMRMHLLQTENICSFRAEGGSNPEVTVTVVEDLSQDEKDQLILEFLTLDDAPFVNQHEQDKIDFKSSNPFSLKNLEEAGNWIETNVTDFDSAKLALKKIAEALAALIRRSDLNQ